LSPYSQSAIRDACLQLVDSAELDRIKNVNKTVFRLTLAGRQKIEEALPALTDQQTKLGWVAVILVRASKANKKATSGLWRLRQRLARWSFRPLNPGVWLGPKQSTPALIEFIKTNQLTGRILILDAKKLLVGDWLSLAHNLWCFTKKSEEYTKFITETRQLLAVFIHKKCLTYKEKVDFSRLFDRFYAILATDPLLIPNPSNVHRQKNKAVRLFAKFIAIVKTAKI